jgi:aminobenzoyl-glutamate transport protein
MCFVIAVLSLILNKLSFKGTLTDPVTFETTIETVNNVFSKEGFQYIVGNSLKNFRNVEPLVGIIISLITITILEVSGLLKHIFGIFKNVKSFIITFLVLFIGIVASFIGDYSYAILLPLTGAFYKSINKDPKVGVMTSFIGITMGYGTGLLYNYQDIVLGNLTQISASNILDGYKFNPLSLIYIMIASTFILSVVGTIMIENNFSKRLRNTEDENLVTSPKALKLSLVAFLVMFVIMIWSIIPGLPLSGWMLDNSAPRYITKLLGNKSPFKDGFMVMILCMALVCSYIYGKASRNIKDSREFNKAISKTFQNTGFIFAGLFFGSIMISMLKWTNIPNVISLNLIELIHHSQMSGVFIVGTTLLICIVMAILNPSTSGNWTIASPILITSLARANISPEFVQMIFKVGDSIGKCFSPFYIFFILMLGFLYKMDADDEDINYFGTMRKMAPTMLVLAITWIIIVLGWNMVGLPIGIGTNSTL